MALLAETPDLIWFEKTETKCTFCSKRATGILRGRRNESYGPHCEGCANRRLKASRSSEKLTRRSWSGAQAALFPIMDQDQTTNEHRHRAHPHTDSAKP
jgi:hypothetical protein